MLNFRPMLASLELPLCFVLLLCFVLQGGGLRAAEPETSAETTAETPAETPAETIEQKPFEPITAEELESSEPSEPKWMSEEQLEQYPFEIEDNYTVTDLSVGQQAVLSRWRRNGKDLFSRKLGILNIKGRKSDLDAMQQLINRKIIKDSQTELWQSLGVMFGDILVNELGLHWVSYEDELGVNKALRWRKTESYIFPVTMFSKRVRFGEKINVHKLYQDMEKTVAEYKAYELKPKFRN